MYFINNLCSSSRTIKRNTKNLLLAVAVLLTLISNAAYADRHSNTRKQHAGISAEQAAAKAKRQYGGEVLRVKRKGDHYEIKILTPSGTVKTISISAR